MNSPKTGLRVASVLFGIFAIGHLAAVDQPSPSHRRNADDPNGRKLDRPDRRRHSLRVAVATGFAIRRVKTLHQITKR